MTTNKTRIQFGITPTTKSHGVIDPYYIEFDHELTATEARAIAEREMAARFGADLVNVDVSRLSHPVTDRPIHA